MEREKRVGGGGGRAISCFTWCGYPISYTKHVTKQMMPICFCSWRMFFIFFYPPGEASEIIQPSRMMKYYILSAIVCPCVRVCVSCALVVSDGGDHALLSSELTAIIHAIRLTDGKLCALYGATRTDCGEVYSPKSLCIIYYLVAHVLSHSMHTVDISLYFFQQE